MVWSVVAAVLLLAAGAVAATFAGREGASFMFDLEHTDPALGRVEPVIDPPDRALSRRVVVVIVDGLRADTSQELPFLNALRARGASGEASSQYPSYSKPNYVNILTGVPPAASGVRTNRYPGTVRLDSLMDRVRAAGMHAGYASDYDAMPRLFLRPRTPDTPIAALPDEAELVEEKTPEAVGLALMADLRGDFDDARYAPWAGGFRDSAEQMLRRDDAALMVLLVGVVDAAGHEYGGDSEEYVAAAHSADQALADVLAEVDLDRDTIVIVADHGHTDSGGHGGLEPEALRVPLVAAGAGIAVGAKPRDGALLQDVAPTVARLLGVSPPGHGLGRSLVELLAIDDAARDRYRAEDDGRAARNAAVVAAELDAARAQRLEKRALRLGALVIGGVLLIATAAWLRWLGGLRLDWRALVVGVPAFFGVYYILIAILGQNFSPSLVPARGHIGSELIKYGIAATVVQIAAGWWALRRKTKLQDRLAAANGVALIGLVIAMTPVALLWTLFPAPYIEVPGPRLLVLIPAVEISVACYAVGVALTLFIEMVVFFARAVDPRVRLLRLERAIERARQQADGADLTGPRKRERRARAAAHRAAEPPS
jgi:hypothetical protein